MQSFLSAAPRRCAAAFLGVLGLLVLSLAPAAAQGRKDVVMLTDGKEKSGRIKSEEYAALVIEVKPGQEETVPWAQVKNIEYGSLPELAAAIASFRNGKWDEARTAFEEILADKKVKPIAQQAALYHTAATLQKQGETDAAIDAYKRLFDAFPKSRYLRQGGEAIANLYASKGDFANAGGALDKLAAGTSDLADFKPQLSLLKGRILELDGKRTAAAREAYDAAEKGAGANTTLLQEAQLGKARCLLVEGKVADAEPIFRKLTLEKAANSVLAGAWNGLGEIYYKDGASKMAVERLNEAAICYMRGSAVYAPIPGESTTEYERSLYGSARCFKGLSEVDKVGDRKKANFERFTRNKEQLAREFPNSVFLKDL